MKNNALIITILIILILIVSYIVYNEYIGVEPPPNPPAPIQKDFPQEVIKQIKEREPNGTFPLQIDPTKIGKTDPFF